MTARVALTRAEAAAALGISLSHFERFVQPELALIRTGRLRLVAVRELERWAKKHSSLAAPPAGEKP